MLGLTTQDTADDLGDLVRDLLDGAEWSVSVRGTWAFARPTGVQLPLQGWKLHVSATSAGATEVVRRCVEVLAGGRTAFKVARSTAVVAEVTGSHADRAQAGKVVTIYPADDATFRQLADALADATDGLAGPRILTDRPIRSGGIVHYRYGAFTGVPMFAPNGMLTAGLRTPDGTVVSDPREARFTPPAWAPDPFGPVPESTTNGLLAGRYAVAGAIRHAARGGVFRATDTSTGRPVVVKHARCHIDEVRPGHDARARLRHEADVLAGLAGLPGVPELVDVFEQERDLFLVETDLGAESLSAWVATHPDAPTRSILRVLADLAQLVERFHDRGLILRDLSPNNVIVGADGTVGIVDLETVLRPGEDPRLCRGKTQAYAAPEAASDERPSQAVDAFSLGAVIAFVLTGEHPLLDEELPSVRTWLDVAGRRLRMPAAVAELVDQLCAQNPARRPSAATTATRLAALARTDVSRPASRRAVEAALEPTHAPLAGPALDEAIAALTSQLVRSLRVEDPEAAVDSSSVGRLTSPTNVHHGSAGIILPLARRVANTPDADLSQTLRHLAAWTARRARDLPSGLPVGMSFGGAGTAYAMSVAADALLDPALAMGAVEDVLLLPSDGVAFDVTHGTAGLGLALVHLWDRTADRRLTDRIVEVTRSLAARSVRDARGLGWPTGATGSRGVGFAHGLAGVAALMQCVANRFDLAEARQLADEAVATLVREAVVVDDCARWRLDLSDRPTTASWWCHGTGGVIVPLVRAPAGTVDPDLLRACGRALVADRRQVGLSYCHGLAGSAEALLDLDGSLPGEGWGVRAAELLALAWSRRRESPDGSLRLGDPVVGSVPDFGVGQAGLLGVMLRLRDGGPRALVPFDGSDR